MQARGRAPVMPTRAASFAPGRSLRGPSQRRTNWQERMHADASARPAGRVPSQSEPRRRAMGEDDVDLLGLYWTVSGPVEVHCRPRVEPLRPARPLRASRARRLQRHRASGTPTSSTCSARRTLAEMRSLFDEYGLRHLELEFLVRLVPRPGRRAAHGLRPDARAALRGGRRAAGRTTSRSATSPAPSASSTRLTEAYGELCADAAEHTDASIVYEFMPYDVERQHARRRARRRRGRGRTERRARASTPGTFGKLAHRARRAPPHPAAVADLGRALRRPVRDRRGRPRRGDQPPQAAGRGRLPDPRLRPRRARGSATTGPWGVEVLCEELRNLPIDEIFDRAYATSVAQLTTD